MQGAGVRLINTDDDLYRYMTDFPENQDFLLQEKAPWSAEAGIFYAREPDSSHGKIISMGFKYIPLLLVTVSQRYAASLSPIVGQRSSATSTFHDSKNDSMTCCQTVRC